MRNSCAKFVDLAGVTSGKVLRFYTANIIENPGIGKLLGFTTLFARLFPSLFHCDLLVFESVNYRVLPIAHTTNKYNNEYKLTFNNYCRRMV